MWKVGGRIVTRGKNELMKNKVVQFNENHKWCGCLGIVTEEKKMDTDTRYMIGVPIPENGTAYIFVMESDNAIEVIGDAELVLE